MSDNPDYLSDRDQVMTALADRREPKPIIDRTPVVADAEADDDDPFPSIH
jgi:hypothetical protein